MAKKSNWSLLKKQDKAETLAYRDVYEDQQLERSSVEEKKTMTGRIILDAVASFLVFLIIWSFITLGQMLGAKLNGDRIERSQNPADHWIHVEGYYYERQNVNQKLTPESYEKCVSQYEDALSDGMPIPPANEAMKYEKQKDGTYVDGEGHVITMQEFQGLVTDYNAEMEKYNQAVERWRNEYTAYTLNDNETPEDSSDDFYENEKGEQISVEKYAVMSSRRVLGDPRQVFGSYSDHYRNVDDFSQGIPNAQYEQMVAEYEEKVANGKVKDDALDVPIRPLNPAQFYTLVPQRDEEGNVLYQTEVQCTEDGEVVLDYDGNPKMVRVKDENGKDIPLVDYYQSVLDAHRITESEYNVMMSEYLVAIEKYKTAYMTHRQMYHPDNIENEPRFEFFAVNKTKVLWSLFLAGVCFAILYAVLKKNLDAQNQMSETADINQYHGDQHVALPEEVQQNYDWFPDIGAHSSVQVSSMISHMALQNKGLKKIELGQFAQDDIKEDGDIVVYKGELLTDDEGNPKTTTVPLIDTDFMEALFDASGLPKDKKYRRYYDTTKIPYNPDGSNIDKLGNYATVADLINDDWEFPVYEPQRPGGAYIVDTAPVNTMVLAITRAGKGQTVIEPTLDMWMREKRQNNMVVNDPKGELLVKNYVRATVRGLQVVQFNLINAMKTDIYNRVPRFMVKSHNMTEYLLEN